jgi:prepilin-type N-terminal cleavage/methylation domain-containing protein
VAIEKIKYRLASEEGFTLIELMIVLLILGILVSISVPSYLNFRIRAYQTAAQANVRSALPAAEAYYQDSSGGNGSYNALAGATLRTEAPGVAPTVKGGYNAAKDGYCVQDTQTGYSYYYTGGNGGSQILTAGTCSTVTYTMA